MLTIEDVIFELRILKSDAERNGLTDTANRYEHIIVLLRELQERRKEPKIICCGECGHSMYDEDGELYCDNPNTDIYYTRYDFACNRSKRRTDGEKQSD